MSGHWYGVLSTIIITTLYSGCAQRYIIEPSRKTVTIDKAINESTEIILYRKASCQDNENNHTLRSPDGSGEKNGSDNKYHGIPLSEINGLSCLNRKRGMRYGFYIGFISGASYFALGIINSEYDTIEEKMKVFVPLVMIAGGCTAFWGAIAGYTIGIREEYIFQSNNDK
jgi:hypothetical protein